MKSSLDRSIRRGSLLLAMLLTGMARPAAGAAEDALAADYAGEPVPLPLVVYDECQSDYPYIPAGWMGDVEAITWDECWDSNPHSGKTCIRAGYKASGWWAGVVWQDPPNDWGDVKGGYDLSGATRLTFWARGQEGGEEVDFSFGLLDKKHAYPDTATMRPKTIKLTADWQQYTLPVRGNRKCIKTGFAWSVPAGAEDVTFFLDDIRYEAEGRIGRGGDALARNGREGHVPDPQNLPPSSWQAKPAPQEDVEPTARTDATAVVTEPDIARAVSLMPAQDAAWDESYVTYIVPEETYYRWKKYYDLDGRKERARRIRYLEDENSKLKRLVGELILENQTLRDTPRDARDE